MRTIGVIGKRFGRLIVLEDYAQRVNGVSRRFLKCKCDCGNITVTSKAKVLRGFTQSCGCLINEIRHNLGSGFKKPRGEAAFNEVYRAYERSARHRGYVFELTKDQFREIITKPCIYCGDSLTQGIRENDSHVKCNGGFRYTGIDRYDNSKGYVIGNCVPCCKKCNRMKTTMTAKEFADQLSKINARCSIWMRPKPCLSSGI